MKHGIAWAALTTLLIAGNVYAEADISICPKVSDIKASAFKSDDAHLPAPYNEGYQYEAVGANGKKWRGETMATADSFLESKYELRADTVDDQDKKVICNYVGTTITDMNGTVSKPYLKMGMEK
ncbi:MULTISPECIES: hypothetical protein [unclassified Pseudomonas]|uniref:hypothetical protein n=1 Tax=unclassified Pseudomonas TaxID=196821 RepID=UPI0025F57B0D|nr:MULTISPECIES: hypothetical protein [unclassified Pseudomonas]